MRTPAPPEGTRPQEHVQKGELLTSEENYYLDWVDEAPKERQTLANDLLARMVTLCTSLAGGSAAFLDERLVGPWVRVAAVIAFLAGLLCALTGIYPRRADVPYLPDVVKAHKERVLSRKLGWLNASAAATAVGFLVVILGLVVRLF